MASNYPPGHPTGISRGEAGGEVYFCEPCNFLLTKEELLAHSETCPGAMPGRAECDKCGAPATHIETERAVNFHLPYCDNCHM
jgi:hypothetical protein